LFYLYSNLKSEVLELNYKIHVLELNHENYVLVLIYYVLVLYLLILGVEARISPRSRTRDTLKADENYKFKPSFGQDDYDIFSERIMDLVKIHDEDKILQTLVLCLRSDDAKKWFADLSQEDKEKLRVNTDNWISRF